MFLEHRREFVDTSASKLLLLGVFTILNILSLWHMSMILLLERQELGYTILMNLLLPGTDCLHSSNRYAHNRIFHPTVVQPT